MGMGKDLPGLDSQNDLEIWTKYNLALQIVDLAHKDEKDPKDATRQLRVLAQEACRRGIFAYRIANTAVDISWLKSQYEVLKQVIEGWPESEGALSQYQAVILEMKVRGLKPAPQSVGMKAAKVRGKATGRKK